MEDSTESIRNGAETAAGSPAHPLLVERAREVAQAAHQGQKDKAGRAYIGHPARVAEHARRRCEEAGVYGYEADLVVAAAWLHDVVEDTTTGEEQLREQFPPQTVDAVMAVTRRPEEDPEVYYARIRATPGAVLVKSADLDDNTDPERTALLEPALRQRLAQKYARSRQLLAQAPSA